MLDASGNKIKLPPELSKEKKMLDISHLKVVESETFVQGPKTKRSKLD